MTEETIRRTFCLNNFESVTLEGRGRDENPKKAMLLAERDCLLKVQAVMVRVFNNRQQHQMANEYDPISYSLVTTELGWIEQELQTTN